MHQGRVVGPCRGCGAKAVREAYVDIKDVDDAAGARRVFIHTAMVKRHRDDPGRPCRGAIKPLQEYLHPPPRPMSLDAYDPDRET